MVRVWRLGFGWFGLGFRLGLGLGPNPNPNQGAVPACFWLRYILIPRPPVPATAPSMSHTRLVSFS